MSERDSYALDVARMNMDPTKTALHHRAEEWEKHQLKAYAIIVMLPDGTVQVDFSFHEAEHVDLQHIGAGAKQLYLRCKEMIEKAALDESALGIRPIDSPFRDH